MRRGLAWMLTATAALSALSLWKPGAPSIVAAIEPLARTSAGQPATVQSTSAMPGAEIPLPLRLVPIGLAPARRDPFVPVLAAALPSPAATVPAPPAPPPPAAPQAPPIQLRFLGTMLDPSGKRLLYLARGEAAILVGPGDRLDEGYTVESLTAESIVLVYPPTDTRVTIPIPGAPQQ